MKKILSVSLLLLLAPALALAKPPMGPKNNANPGHSDAPGLNKSKEHPSNKGEDHPSNKSEDHPSNKAENKGQPPAHSQAQKVSKASDKHLTVQKDNSALRSEPSFSSKVIANLNANTGVDVLKDQKAWRFVQYQQQQGWMHLSSLLRPQFDFKAGKVIGNSFSGEDVALAAKGLEQIETEFKSQNVGLNYAAVNKMELMEVSDTDLEQFSSEESQ